MKIKDITEPSDQPTLRQSKSSSRGNLDVEKVVMEAARVSNDRDESAPLMPRAPV